MGQKIYRDGLEETSTGEITVFVTPEGHTVEKYEIKSGKNRFFATLAGSYWCAHGDTVADAIADAIWKDPARRPSMQSLVDSIKNDGVTRKITLNEFRVITGACVAGCKSALAKAGKDETPITAYEIRDLISVEWGNKLLSLLGWEKVGT